MGDVAVENPANIMLPHKRQPPSNSIPAIDSLDGIDNDENDEYSTMKKLERHLEYVSVVDGQEHVIDSWVDTSTSKKST